MTLVSGCALPSGVLIGTDSRVTFWRPDGTVVCRKDRGMKVFELAAHTIVGFSGDCRLARELLRDAITALRHQSPLPKVDPVSISEWLPRFLGHRYQAATKGLSFRSPRGRVVFMVGSALSAVLGGTETKIDAIFSSDDDAQPLPPKAPRRGLPWGSADAASWTECMGARNILHTLQEPTFEPRVYRPLQFAAIGSGQDVREELHRAPLAIYQGDSTDSFLDDYMRGFKVRAGLTDCGGLHQMLFVTSRGVQAISTEKTVFLSGGRRVRIGMEYDRGRWTQINYSTGRRLELELPWTIDGAQPDELFDDLVSCNRN